MFLKSKILILFACLIFCSAYAQRNHTVEWCSFSDFHQHKLKTDSSYRKRTEEINTSSYYYQLAGIKNRKTKNNFKPFAVHTIPVVVHVIHANGEENISEQQILDGIDHLNKAFAGLSPYNGEGSTDMGIRFCLAQRDPSGNFTNGINRVTSALTNLDAATQDQSLKNLVIWDPEKYINIWLVKEICRGSNCAVAGYAYFASAHGLPFDGIVNEAKYFGSSPDNSKVHIHEMGHYFNLYHTFENGCPNTDCLLNGDRICDTPPDNSVAPVYPCNSFVNSCQTDEDDTSLSNPFRPVSAGGSGDQNDLFKNFMDYGFQECQNMFTPGQKDRILAALLGPRASLLQSDGCQPPCSSPISIGFTASSTTIQAGSSVSFTNTTSGAIQYEWKINGNIYSTSVNYLHTFHTAGTYIVTLTATADPYCIKTLSDTIHVSCPAVASFTASATHIQPGQSVTFTNTSSGADSYLWLVDNTSSGTSADLTYTFSEAGNYSVGVVAQGTGCADTSALITIQVKSCTAPVRGNKWYFGDHCGLDFSSGAPSAILDNQMYSSEGSSMAFDKNGDLLFYSNGDTVFTKDHSIMPNGTGLMGGNSSTQACLIIPYPGYPGKFILFTSDQAEDNCVRGYRYSVIDMNLNGGNGAVTNEKNILLYAPGTEKLTATYHDNRHDIWVMTHEYHTGNFAAYLVTADGVSSTPVISSIGSAAPFELGSMKFSHNGKKLANAMVGFDRAIEIFDFNKSTGVLSNAISIPLSHHQPYGIEFSPDDSRLYVSCIAASPTYLFQVNMNAGSPTDIINSLTPLSSHDYGPDLNVIGFAGMQLGPDNKIYVSCSNNPYAPYLSVINNPNEPGTACNFSPSSIDLNGRYPFWGIPNIFETLHIGSLNIEGPDTVCVSDKNVPFIITNKSALNFSAYSKRNNKVFVLNDTLISVDFIYPGKDTLMVIDSSCADNPVKAFLPVVVHPLPLINLGNDTTFCDQPIAKVLNAGNGFKSYLWQDGSIGQFLSVNDTGTYKVTVTDYNNCSHSDTIKIRLHSFGLKDTAICEGEIVVLNPGDQFYSYYWQDGSSNQTYTAFLPGTYWVKVQSDCGELQDTSEVTVKPLPLVTFEGLEASYCRADGPSLLTGVPSGGVFGGAVYNGNSFYPAKVSSGEHTIYYYFIDSNGCSGTSYQKTQVINCSFEIPNLITRNDDNLNEYFFIPGLPEGYTLEIYNRWNQLVYRKENYDHSWNGEQLSEGIYFYQLYNEENSFQGWIQLLKYLSKK